MLLIRVVMIINTRPEELIVGNGAVLCDGAIGAMDGVRAGVVVPIGAFFNRPPFGYSALVGDVGQVFAIVERPIADARHAVRDRDGG